MQRPKAQKPKTSAKAFVVHRSLAWLGDGLPSTVASQRDEAKKHVTDNQRFEPLIVVWLIRNASLLFISDAVLQVNTDNHTTAVYSP